MSPCADGRGTATALPSYRSTMLSCGGVAIESGRKRGTSWKEGKREGRLTSRGRNAGTSEGNPVCLVRGGQGQAVAMSCLAKRFW